MGGFGDGLFTSSRHVTKTRHSQAAREPELSKSRFPSGLHVSRIFPSPSVALDQASKLWGPLSCFCSDLPTNSCGQAEDKVSSLPSNLLGEAEALGGSRGGGQGTSNSLCLSCPCLENGESIRSIVGD